MNKHQNSRLRIKYVSCPESVKKSPVTLSEILFSAGIIAAWWLIMWAAGALGR